MTTNVRNGIHQLSLDLRLTPLRLRRIVEKPIVDDLRLSLYSAL